jgi:hypothetical protein
LPEVARTSEEENARSTERSSENPDVKLIEELRTREIFGEDNGWFELLLLLAGDEIEGKDEDTDVEFVGLVLILVLLGAEEDDGDEGWRSPREVESEYRRS